MLKTGSSTAIAIPAMNIPMIMIISGSRTVVTFFTVLCKSDSQKDAIRSITEANRPVFSPVAII